MKMFKTIKVKLTLISILLLVIALGILGMISLSKFENQTEIFVNDKLIELTEMSSKIIESEIDKGKLIAKLISGNSRVDLFISGDRSLRNEVFEYLSKQKENVNGMVESIILTDKDGKILISGDDKHFTADLSERKFFKEAMKTEDVFESEVIISKVTNNRVIALCSPIKKNGEIVGTIIVSINFDNIAETAKKLKVFDNGYAYMFDLNGLIVQHPNEELLFNANILNLGVAEAENVLENINHGKDGEAFYTYKGEYKYVRYTRVGNWGFAVTADYDDFMSESYQIRKHIIIVLILSAIIASILSFLFTSEYLKQIKTNNTEIAIKNELLQSSEEELIAQIDEINFQKEYIEFFADHDILTELPNRRKFIEQLQKFLTEGRKGIVALLDLDDFKKINDTLGHVFGDRVLKEFSNRLKVISGKNNIFVSRFGGDEFLILSDCETEEEIKKFAFRLHEALDKKFIINDNEVEIKFSMGITFFPNDSNDIDELIMNSDLALYSIKNEAKNDYAIFNENMKKKLAENTEIELILSEAIEKDGFKMLYQPQVELMTGEITSYEALVRLKEYSISPGQFIPIAEKNGMIIKIGRIVTKKVIEQLSIWKEKGYSIKPISINYSAIQMNDNNYFDFLMNTLESYNVNPKFIEIEITENILLKNNEKVFKFLKKLRNTNIKIAIDDFGTGYSSLSYLTFLPIDKVKFDRSLNLELLNMNNIEVMNSLISVMHSLELIIVSEGIEEYEHIKKLKKGNCDIVQGYYFSKPLKAKDVEKTFNKNYLNQIGNEIS